MPDPAATAPRLAGPSADWAAAGRSPVAAAMASRDVRITSGILAAACLALLSVAWWLDPSSEGLGTHTQLGLSECGWITSADMPCPTCGMTTAFSHAADGDLAASFIAQPFGMILAVATGIVVVVGGFTAATGSTLAPFLAGMVGPRVGWLALVLLLLAWGWKIVDHRGLL